MCKDPTIHRTLHHTLIIFVFQLITIKDPEDRGVFCCQLLLIGGAGAMEQSTPGKPHW
jgi:hypothetical protein